MTREIVEKEHYSKSESLSIFQYSILFKYYLQPWYTHNLWYIPEVDPKHLDP